MDPDTKQISANAATNQYVIRMMLYLAHWDIFKEWGIPESLYPGKEGDPDIGWIKPETKTKYQQGLEEFKQKIKDGKTFIGRYIFINGEDFVNGGFRQNNMIITGYQRDAGGGIEIQKKAKDTGRAMPDVQFTVQNIADGRYFNADGELSNEEVVLTTDAQGIITIKNKEGSGELKSGMTVKVKEVGMNATLINERISDKWGRTTKSNI